MRFTLRYSGPASGMRDALAQFRADAPGAGTIAADEINRRRLQRMLDDAARRPRLQGGEAS